MTNPSQDRIAQELFSLPFCELDPSKQVVVNRHLAREIADDPCNILVTSNMDAPQRPLSREEWDAGSGCESHSSKRSGSCHDCAMLELLPEVCEQCHDKRHVSKEEEKGLTTVQMDWGMVAEEPCPGCNASGCNDTECRACWPRFLNVLLHDKSYGGPEEGGWWYDTYQRAWFEVVTSPSHMAVRRKALEEVIKEKNQGRHPVSSVLSDGEFVLVVTFQVPLPSYYPEHTPRYE